MHPKKLQLHLSGNGAALKSMHGKFFISWHSIGGRCEKVSCLLDVSGMMADEYMLLSDGWERGCAEGCIHSAPIEDFMVSYLVGLAITSWHVCFLPELY